MRFTITGVALVASLALSACSTKPAADNEAVCKDVKPGTVTTANAYCVIMNEDPVDPELVREYKGQRVGFCCKGCLPKWEALTDGQKDAALAKAIAKGKPKP